MKKQIFILIVFLILPIKIMAQSDGTLKPSESPIPTETPVSPPTEIPTNAATAPAGATSVSRTISPTPSPLQSSGPLVSPIITPSSLPSQIVSMPQVNSTPTDDSLLYWIVAVVGSTLGLTGFVAYKAKIKKKTNESGRCDSIKELLEQKKKELEDMIRNWPEEKIKAMAKKQVLGELKKDQDAKKIIDTAEDLKKKHDKLKETIELLQKKYDLCMLDFSLPKDQYKGKIVDNSLSDKKILDNIKITKTYPTEDWTLHDVLIEGEKINELGKYLSDGPWYMHFWQEGKDEVIIVFKDKTFKIKYSDKSTWNEAIEYGKSKGISEEQLDFDLN